MNARKKSTRAGGGEGKDAAKATTPEAPTFEEALARLEELVQRLEEGEVPLEESLQAYAEGVKLIRQCARRLDSAETMIRELNESEGEIKLTPSTLTEPVPGSGEDEDDDAGW